MLPLFILFSCVFLMQLIHTSPIQTVFRSNRMDEDMLQDVIDFYEGMVDATLNTDSEVLLLHLIHLPKEELDKRLKAQIHLLGLNPIPDEKLSKVPVIIGSHVQEMNNYIYDSIESLVKQQEWNNQQDLLLSLSAFHINMGKSILHEIEKYQLIEKIKNEIKPLTASSNWISDLFTSAFLNEEHDFLKQYLSELGTNLLMDFHIQFYDFYSRIQPEFF